ncbi:MAG: ATP-binding protein, partial [Candidatus Omnitrophica bacterium]|nr:ATP-binding protein [Candidatus Omnitrophota bacterium]
MITPKKEKILFCWSAGKDSAMALYKLHSSGKYEIACLLTTVTEGYDRVGMHGVRRELLKKQVKELGIPCEEVFIPKDSSNGEYEARMQAVLSKY